MGDKISMIAKILEENICNFWRYFKKVDYVIGLNYL